jgi:hypothetical protein
VESSGLRLLSRFAGESGVAAFALLVAGALVSPPLWDAPATNASGAEVAAYLHDHRGRIIAGILVYALGMGLFSCFAAGLWAWLRQVEPGPGGLSAVFGFAAVVFTTLIFAGFVPFTVGAYRLQEPALAQALRDVGFGLIALSGIPTALCLGAYAALVWRHGWLPAWTAWLAALGVAAHLVVAASFVSTSNGVVSLEGDVIVLVPATYFGWILAVSAVLLRHPR